MKWNSLRKKINDSLDVRSLLGISKTLSLVNLLNSNTTPKLTTKPNEIEFIISETTNFTQDNLPSFKDARVSSKEIQTLGFHSTDKAITDFLQQQGIFLQIAS
jgi:hypothetical protein